MLFNSLDFALFLPLVFVLYWFVTNRSLRLQNVLLLVASYFFYACWDWRFMFLLLFSTALDYYTGLRMEEASGPRARKVWFWLSVGINLGFLGVFKYYNFFADSFASGLALLGVQAHPATLQVILPVGISFYTFHGLSYVIDIYQQRIKAERNAVDYALFVSFFPLLVAGPIERATHLLPQIRRSRIFSYDRAADGMRQILWGLFKKIVIADNCAVYANVLFDDPMAHSGSALFLGAIFFAFQIYGDFSGYSDIALGTARLFGIELLRNFSYPYFSRDMAEFWRRWHISLSSWFRDYLYIPLGGSKGGFWMKVRNTFAIFLVSGFWHGANWTFLVWGAMNALFYMPLLISGKNRDHVEVVAAGRILPTPREFMQMSATFLLTVLAWIFFRAENLPHAIQYLTQLFSGPWGVPRFDGIQRLPVLALLMVLFIAVEWTGRTREHPLATCTAIRSRAVRWSIYAFIIFLIGMYMPAEESPFIYFQF